MAKRRKLEDADDDDTDPRKSRRTVKDTDHPEEESSPKPTAETPSGRKSILRKTLGKPNGYKSMEGTPSSLRKVLFSTPGKPAEEDEDADGDKAETPTALRNDRSARRKSQRMLQQRVAEVADSEAEEDEQDEAIAEAILDEDGDEDSGDVEDADIMDLDTSATPATPSKAGKPRGRPKGRRRERTPSPPPNLPPHELFFFQNRTGGNKTSANTMSSHTLLSHDDYFARMNAYEDPHSEDVKQLKQLHKRAFDQWIFELHEGFNLCLYGYGSKHNLVMDFAEHLYCETEKAAKIVVVNGYTPGLTIRDILASVSSVVFPKTAELPAQPPAMLDLLLTALDESPPNSTINLIIHSLDHSNLRKPTAQAVLARLTAHPSISLIATCDTPNFPLLWGITLASQFRFLFHDATTFEPYKAEIDVVEDVNALLGRSGRRLGGKDGVGYVLKSLPENARNLFRILVAEQLALTETKGDVMLNGLGEDSDPDDILGAEDDDQAAAETPSRRVKGRPAKKAKKQAPKAPAPVAAMGVEYRTLYHKTVEEFVCSSEVNFRTLLKEFHDHQMIESRKDALGTERLIVPFRNEELEAILEELV